jgi:hypothetical protein
MSEQTGSTRPSRRERVEEVLASGGYSLLEKHRGNQPPGQNEGDWVEPNERGYGPPNEVELDVAQLVYGHDLPCGTEDVLDHVDTARRVIHGLLSKGYKIQRPPTT